MQKIIKKCISCFRAKLRGISYLIGNHPEFRVNECFPFNNVDIDYGEPYLLKDKKLRCVKIIKGYICLNYVYISGNIKKNQIS